MKMERFCVSLQLKMDKSSVTIKTVKFEREINKLLAYNLNKYRL